MKNQANPWLTSNLFILGLGLLPAAILIGALLYFTAWAFAFSFTDLALVGRKSVEWSWVGLQNFERLFTRRGFLESLWTTVIFVFFSAIVIPLPSAVPGQACRHCRAELQALASVPARLVVNGPE